MKKILFLTFFAISFLTCHSLEIKTDYPQLTDNNLTTYYIGTKGKEKIILQSPSNTAMLSYKIYSSGETPPHDPSNWVLKGSNDGKKWTKIDERKDQKFCSRYQEILCVIQNPGNYRQYMFEATTADKKEKLVIAEILLSEKNMLAGWENFKYPHIEFESLNPNTEGSKVYHKLVQNPDEYIKYHAQKVAEILYYTANDPINDVQNIEYTLEDKEGVSAKGGNSPSIHIFYSTRHIEKSAKESLYKLDFETRGVLYHELTHGYQFEPKGIGNYGNNKTFWACIEGIADAVRAEAGLFDMSTRKPGGNWMDGYRTTGFFLQWLTTKDPDAIRKFHLTVRDLDVWSFDKAIKAVFGPNSSIEGMWNEYQEFLKRQ
ncbi:basic secretory family protein [Dysgonomonas sp. Marseille-P4677]|uniref:basic secretory family protein n=1 Tax=Dysgonomonas sp. Marseille-P4677 TaxID=2364790 RepID=UPI0019131567|nr:basic secretory family protein [Dysgonomonas sp. Marseille-P4677]MBK5720588.1 basic secretory family protein [Dysgonomonas sp. Marseille-P4677]